MNDIRFILFDAVNTLIHKPTLWDRITSTLAKYKLNVDLVALKERHKLISEVIFFPDRTSADFYRNFNTELLYSVGVVPTPELLDELFSSCSYLPWEAFEDTSVICQLPQPKGILSNFNTTLATKIEALLPNVFSSIITSEELKSAKPDRNFYKEAITRLGYQPRNILYIGDSIKLDMHPALDAGMQCLLVDRGNIFPHFPYRVTSFAELKEMMLR
jgi:putative hydrolase of the HAD superfamily